MTNMEHFIVINDWANNDNCEEGVDIVGIAHSFEEAKEIFYKRVVEEKKIAEDNGYEIYEDDDTVFDAGESGYYISEHTKLYIQQV